MPARLLALVLCLPALYAADPVLDNAQAKLHRITDDQTKPGEVIVFTPAELNAWVHYEIPKAIPEGIREPKIELGAETASASAVVDFLKIQQSRGKSTGFISKMFEGERPLKMSVRTTSEGGKCTVFLTRLEISGVTVEGTLLDLLIRNVFLPLYPDAKIGEPFDLEDNIDRLDLRPDGLRVTIKK